MYCENKLFQKYGHSCQLLEETDPIYKYYPGDSLLSRCRRTLARYRLISETHPYTRKYIRSQARVILERNKHLQYYPYMIHPFSSIHLFWKIFMGIVIVAALITVPIEVNVYFLGYVSHNGYWIFTRLLLDAFCFIDIFMQAFTGYYNSEKRIVILNPLQSFWYYFRTGLIPSLCASFPTYLVVLYLHSYTKIMIVILLLKLSVCFYWIRVKRTVLLLGERFEISYCAQKIPLMIVTAVIVLHWVACIQSMFYSLHTEAFQRISFIRHKLEITPLFLVVSTHFNSTSQILLATYGEIHLSKANTCFYFLYLIGLWLISSILKMIFIVRMKSVLESMSGTKSKYARMVIHLKAYMHYKKLPKFLRDRILCYYEFRFQKSYFRDSVILNILCGQLRQDIQVYTCRSMVEKVPFFKNISQGLLVRIAQELIHEFYLQNDVILRADTIANCMYFILSGTVGVYSEKGREICHLSDGDHFGEIALVVPNKKRIASVIALECCSVYRLDRKDFLKAIIPFPDLLFSIEQIAKERMETTEQRNTRSSMNFF